MHPYLPHLLQDIRNAHKESPIAPLEQDDLENHFREIDRWLSGDAEQTLSYYCGLQTSDFPPVEQFVRDEIQLVCRTFDKMLSSWGVVVDVPETLPLPRKYTLMVGLLNEDFTPVGSGTFVFDFCTGYAPECELKEYCRCLEYWERENTKE